MTYEQVKHQLSGVSYSSAIDNYNSLKQSFITEYSQAIGDYTQKNSQEYINNFINEINNGNFQGKSFALANELLLNIETAATAKLSGENISKLAQLSGDFTKKYSDLGAQAKNLLKSQVEELYDLNTIHWQLKQQLQRVAPNNGGVSSADIFNQVKGYLAQKLYYNNIEGKNATFRKDIIAGYFEEALIHGATSQLTQHLDNAIGGTLAIGSKTIVLDGKHKVDTIFDEYFNFFSSNLSASFESSIEVNPRELTSGFGAQTKLWRAPWTLQKPVLSKSITTNSNLYNAWTNKKSWIKGVIFLENRVNEVFGDNVMYILGNQFYWTADLLSQARQNDYFVAFGHNGKEFTGKVNLETIDMSKPYKD